MLPGALELFRPNEAKTRKELIDPALKKAGWDVNNPDLVRIEIPVDGFDPKAWDVLKKRIRDAGGIYDVELPSGVSDYALYRPKAMHTILHFNRPIATRPFTTSSLATCAGR